MPKQAKASVVLYFDADKELIGGKAWTDEDERDPDFHPGADVPIGAFYWTIVASRAPFGEIGAATRPKV